MIETTPMSDEDWDDFIALIRESVVVREVDPAKRFAVAALADPERCGRVLLALVKERGIQPYSPSTGVSGVPRRPTLVGPPNTTEPQD